MCGSMRGTRTHGGGFSAVTNLHCRVCVAARVSGAHNPRTGKRGLSLFARVAQTASVRDVSISCAMRGSTDVSSTSNFFHSGLFDRRRNIAYRHRQSGRYSRGAVVQCETPCDLREPPGPSSPLGSSQDVRSRRAWRHAVNGAVFRLQLVSRAGLLSSTV